MNPQIPRADELPVPGPPWLFQVLLLVTFLLHLLAMNALLGGTLTAALALTRRAAGDEWLARRILRALPVAFAATVTLGVAPLLFAQVLYGRLLYTSSVLLAWPWLAVPAAAAVAYALTYRLARQAHSDAVPGPAAAWAVFALLVGVATVFVQNMTLMLDPGRWKDLYFADPGGGHLHVSDPQILPRILHVVTGGVAVGALFAALLARAGAKADPEPAAAGCGRALRITRNATLLQFPLGVWLLLSQPGTVRASLLGGSFQGTVSLALGVLVGGYLVVVATRALRAGTTVAATPRLAAAAALGVASMVLVRDEVRRMWLEPGFVVEDRIAAPQWGVLAVFLCVFVAGLAVLAWMVRAWATSAREPVTGSR